MPPAQQGLEADDLAAPDIHFRLVRQLELPFGYRLSQADLELHALCMRVFISAEK